MNRAFLLASLIHIRGTRNHREAPEARIWSLAEAFLGAHAVRTPLPLHLIARKHVFTKLTDYIGGCAPQTFQQRVIGLHHAKFSIVQQHEIVDGIEGIGPLPVRAQDLL